MKKTQVATQLCLLVALSLIGCQPSGMAPSQMSVTVPTQEASQIPKPTALSSAIPSMTLIPVATLSDTQRSDFAENMLLTNGGCELPCWWGGNIIPGQTTTDEAISFFESRGITPIHKQNIVAKNFGVPPGIPSQYTLNVELKDENEVISLINIEGRNNGPQTRFISALREHYSWSQILKVSGKPSQVFVALTPPSHTEPNDINPADYIMVLVYERLGLMLYYSGAADELVPYQKVQACPQFDQVRLIKITLVAPSEGQSLVDSLGPLNPIYWSSWEESTKTPIDTFYEKFSVPSGTMCFQRTWTSTEQP